jgi:hypothetical protein
MRNNANIGNGFVPRSGNDDDAKQKETISIQLTNVVKNKNSWVGSKTSLPDNNNNRTLSEEQQDDQTVDTENTWLRLLNMVASVYPQPFCGSTWKKRIGWYIFPLLMHAFCIILFVGVVDGMNKATRNENRMKQTETVTNPTFNFTEVEIISNLVYKGKMSEGVFLSGYCFIVIFLSASLTYTRKGFLQHIPGTLLMKFETIARNMFAACVLVGISVGIYMQVDKSNIYEAVQFFLLTTSLVAISCSLTLRAYVFISNHGVHFKRWKYLAEGDNINKLTKCIIESNKILRKESSSFLESPIALSMTLIFIHIVVGAYTVYAYNKVLAYETDLHRELLGYVIVEYGLPDIAVISSKIRHNVLLVVLEIPILLSPTFALTVIGKRAEKLLHDTIYFNHKLDGGEFTSLITRYEHIFPHIYLFGFTVTKAKVATAFVAAAVPLLGNLIPIVVAALV